jgi:hypothetical protein
MACGLLNPLYLFRGARRRINIANHNKNGGHNKFINGRVRATRCSPAEGLVMSLFGFGAE